MNPDSPSLRFLPTPLDTSGDDPFKDDAFERRPLAENLTKLVASFAQQSFVLGVNGSWGSGKTAFLDMWDGYLKREGFRTLRFNAWENDFADDPFAAVLSEFRQLTKVAEAKTATRFEKLYDKVAEKSLPILKRVSANALKHVTLGALDLKSAEMEEMIAELAEESAKHALERCEQNR